MNMMIIAVKMLVVDVLCLVLADEVALVQHHHVRELHLLHHQLGDGPDGLPLLVGLHAVKVAVELCAVHHRDARVKPGHLQ